MRKKLIIFLIRTRLGLKAKQRFRFVEQKNKRECYFFASDSIVKIKTTEHGEFCCASSVSLNWLLNDKCQIELVK